MSSHSEDEIVLALEKPHPRLMTCYLVRSLWWFILAPFAAFYYWRRYKTLRYRFDHRQITVSWGQFSRSEIQVPYERIQDLHLKSGPFERTLGLARIEVQTASGDAKAEIVLEGFKEFREIRSFLFRKTRQQPTEEPKSFEEESQKVVEALNQVTAALRELQRRLPEPAPAIELLKDEDGNP